MAVLNSVGHAKLILTFREHEVEESYLKELSNEDLLALGINKIGLRKKLLYAFNGGKVSASVSKLLEILNSLGLQDLEANFKVEEITDDVLYLIDDADLIKIGLSKLGWRKKVLRACASHAPGVINSPSIGRSLPAGGPEKSRQIHVRNLAPSVAQPAVRRDVQEKTEETNSELSEILPAGSLLQVMLPGEVEMTFCFCPPGDFRMGLKPVKISRGFWIGQVPVTQAQYEAIVGNNPSHFQGDDFPVESVSWLDAQKYIKSLKAALKDTGHQFILPTEAQWEYACRAGTTTEFWCGSTLTTKQGNFDNALQRTSAVRSYAPNPWGLYDTHGNVWEWCSDWFDIDVDGGKDPTGPASGDRRVHRGGAWFNVPAQCRSGVRRHNAPEIHFSSVGFRIAIALPEPVSE
jgi:formylglycine-generating enzyme required for sulfatase activity